MGAESVAEQGGQAEAEAGAKGLCVCVAYVWERICLLLDYMMEIYILIYRPVSGSTNENHLVCREKKSFRFLYVITW